ncbi:MAG: type II toxin-antitoxin system VapC family toxin [Candidatus Nanohaloarchaea archaeon]|nr:type II toxin-antitoxin system VapC family toxin [Candidatus Nanohaloarchaea archaeon]
MKTVVDTSVLMALLNQADDHTEEAAALLGRAYKDGGIVINTVVYAELSAYFEEREEVDAFLAATGVRVEQIDRQAVFRAGQAFREYLDARPDGLQCPECGTVSRSSCPDCGRILGPRQHVPSDFLIGADAAVQADRLLTFDEGFFTTYFPDLDVVAPA